MTSQNKHLFVEVTEVIGLGIVTIGSAIFGTLLGLWYLAGLMASL